MAQPCVVCHAKDADVVCDDDRRLLAHQLEDMPRKYAALTLKLLPGGSTSDGLGVHTSQVEAPLGINVTALSLLAAGSEQVSAALHPLVRRWSVTSTVRVETVVKGETVVEERRIPQWFNEAVLGPDGRPVMVPDDDQVGALPPREWLDMTVRAWRAQMGHHVPDRTSGAIAHRAGPAAPVTLWPKEWQVFEPQRRIRPMRSLWLLATPAGTAVFCFLAAVERARQLRVARFLGTLGPVTALEEEADPLALDIETRFGEPPASQSMAWDIDYLLTWLDTACDRDLAIADFAAELGALTAELERAIGEKAQQTYLGRCPAFLIEELPPPEGHTVPVISRKPCGAALWHQTGWAQVPCSRCHSVWDVRGPSAVRTVREIRRVWPLDRRRRYAMNDFRQLRYPPCPACSTPVTAHWREVTAPGDKDRYWQITKVECQGCGSADARRVA